jgi:hypothetical protein
MPNSLENIVRPFTTEDTAPERGVATIPQPSQNVILIVTGGGQVKSGSFNYSLSFTLYADAKQKEVTDSGGSSDFLPTPIGPF